MLERHLCYYKIMRQLYVFFLMVLLFVTTAMPPRAYASITPTEQVNPGCIPVENNICIPTDVGGFVGTYYGYGLSMIGGVSLLFIMFGGYMILTSKGNPDMLNNGKSYIGYAIIGLLLAIFGFVFTQFITHDILKIPGFS